MNTIPQLSNSNFYSNSKTNFRGKSKILNQGVKKHTSIKSENTIYFLNSLKIKLTEFTNGNFVSYIKSLLP